MARISTTIVLASSPTFHIGQVHFGCLIVYLFTVCLIFLVTAGSANLSILSRLIHNYLDAPVLLVWLSFISSCMLYRSS
ncbi:hypothetical protein RchiOBHm_Chr5g0021791 [Rosa chinensis]|uniref:Uncharacterized protein n=1 Tax=Rosa chinensis TaxID=74649 RepID=A0A2P6Q7N2_ROSCH|nr:hypothetical protein RchiOBHm_Chr5g0021791 [Rosa chinensis]